MDITPARLTSLLNEALTPQPVPSARPDPATAALVKALVQPPAPTMQSAQFEAQALGGPLAKAPAQSSQRQSSSVIEDAYRAVMETDVDADETPARSPALRADADLGARGFAQPQPVLADSPAKAMAVAAPPSFSPSVAPTATVLVAANGNAQRPHGAAIRPAGSAPRSEPGQTSLWAISVVTAIVSAVTTTIVVLLLR